ncbi:hypothetical protein TYRP_001650 [Tyrophagus putrescentiae]|nr:hypothetical protein TYRP_001650 [Tyrophagus putrescentiae]
MRLVAAGRSSAIGRVVSFRLLSNGSPWRHLAHQKRPPTLTSLAPLARPSSAGVFGDLAAVNALLLGPRSLRSRDPRRRSLTTAKSRQTSPPWAVHCCPRNNCAPPAAQAAQAENGGSERAKSESAQLPR